jgi:hypothetical protein
MPCGGIYPLDGHWSRPYLRPGADGHGCLVCQGPVVEAVDLFVEEWDAYLHRKCLGPFLTSPEGIIVMRHGHEIVLPEIGAQTEPELPPEARGQTTR